MEDLERERRMPVFFLISIVLHALLFLIAPRVPSGLFAGLFPGDQGGLTYVTLVDVTTPERPRAAVAEAARRPQAIPQPQPRPEPAPPAEQQAKPEPGPARSEAEVRVPEVRAEVIQEQPQEEKPTAVTPSVAEARPQPEARPATPAEAPSASDAEVGDVEVAATLTPVLTAPQGTRPVPAVPAPPQVEEEVSSRAATAAESGPPAQSELPAGEESASASEPGGTGARENVSSAAPNAELSTEPALPPMGLSMISSPGSYGWPKNFVGVINRALTVEVAVIVDPAGNVLETVVTSSSGIDAIDDYSVTVATRGMTYRPYDETYEIRVVFIYDPEARSLTHRVDGLIKVPPTVGSFAR